MKTHNLQQGTQAWHDFRANHFGASEASAMLGLSPYKSRTELLREKKTGISPEVDARTQRIFDKGHEVEELARPIAEQVIGDDLYPVVCSSSNLSASCDGLTLDQSIAWECKQFNAGDFELVKNGELPEKHWPQCQQVLFITDAEKLLFTISDGTPENTAHVWVLHNEEQQQRILSGWEQFAKDLEKFEPEPEVIQVKAEPVMALPALSIQVGGSISIQSNLDRFGDRLKSFIEETNSKPETDQDFANLEQACKVLKEAEDALKQAESNALAQTASVDEMRRTVAFLGDMARTNRLTFEKLVKSEKESRKNQIILRSKDDYAEHCRRLQAELPVTFIPKSVDFAAPIKGKKTLSSMQDAVSTMLANAKIEADSLALDLREKHVWYIENAGEYSFLFSDLSSLIYKASDDFKAVCQNRIAQHKEQVRLKEEAAKRAQAERIAEQEKHEQQTETIADDQAKKSACADVVLEEKQPVEIQQDQARTVDSKSVSNQEANGFQKTPQRIEIVETVSKKWNVSNVLAEQWLVEIFAIRK